MEGIKNFLEFLNENWTGIMICLGIGISIFHKIKNYVSLSTDEKISMSKKQLKETVLKMVSEAELQYEDYRGAGALKRSEVISRIFNDYPVLSKVTDQESLLKELDSLIKGALREVRNVIL